MAFSCELPEDICRIVKAYSMPAFVHWRLFNESKQVVPARHLLDVREALSGPNADNVCQSLTAYMNAVNAHALSLKELCEYQVSIGAAYAAYWSHETQTVIRPALTEDQVDTRTRLREVVAIARANGFNAYRALLVTIHGEQMVHHAEYLDRRRDRYGWDDYGAPLTLRDWDEDA